MALVTSMAISKSALPASAVGAPEEGEEGGEEEEEEDGEEDIVFFTCSDFLFSFEDVLLFPMQIPTNRRVVY